jgi:hypothetical protein
MVPEGEFTEEQRRYLEGLARGIEVARLRHENGGNGRAAPPTPAGPDAAQLAAQDRAAG